MRRFLAPALPGEGGLVRLSPEVSHHLLRVAGIAPGEAVVLFDGEGRQAGAILRGVEAGQALLEQQEVAASIRVDPVHLLVAVCKHAAMDTLLRMATELGATHIQPLHCARSVATGDRGDRWERIAEGAAAQCGRADLPTIGAVLPLAAALAALPEGLTRRVFVPGGPRRGTLAPPCALLLGPEGGLSAAEVDLALAAGFEAEGLGPRILRADTAVAAALARVG